KRVAVLLPFLDEAQKAAATPLVEQHLQAYRSRLTSPSTTLPKDEKELLEKLHDRLLERRIQASVVAPDEKRDWKKGLDDWGQFLGKGPHSLWAVAWRVECMDEVARASGG